MKPLITPISLNLCGETKLPVDTKTELHERVVMLSMFFRGNPMDRIYKVDSRFRGNDNSCGWRRLQPAEGSEQPLQNSLP